MWYVIQTVTGKEQELADVIERILSGQKKKYEYCFVIYREYIWRFGGKHRLRKEPLFPSYVFVETAVPERFFLELKQVPKLSKLLGAEGSFWGIYQEEEDFLRLMLEKGLVSDKRKEIEMDRRNKEREYVVRPVLVQVNGEGKIIGAEGVLGQYLDRIVKQRLRKRSVVIEVPFLGSMRRIQLGIRLENDDFIGTQSNHKNSEVSAAMITGNNE